MTKDSSAKRKAGKRKPEKLSFTQDFIPIKNLEHGIIETTDGRYIKILEIEPINFMLRSEEEQYEIICSFASWLKISPVHLQFKSITRKADSDKHIAMLRKEMETEESEQCKKLSEGYIRLIKDVGSREALTRRFFLIFRYEELRRNENSDYGQICSTLLTAEQNARAYFMQCGNNILQPKDPDEATAEILYMFFNRRSCVEEPFHSRVDRIVLDTMAAKNKVIGIDPVPHIRMAHFIAPRGIDLTHRNYIIMDGLYYSFLYIKGNGYPNKVRAGWMSSLINAGEGIDVDVFLRRENRSKTIDKVAQRIRLNRTKLKSIVEKLGYPYGETQGNATLAGAVYGVYRYDELVDTYVTDKNGYFLTDYYPCGEGWNIREITPSEGYLLDETVYWLGVTPGQYTREKNTEELDVYEDIIFGSLYLIKHMDDGSTGLETVEAGAEFEVFLKTAGSYESARDTERDYLTTDKHGYAGTKQLPYGIYTVRQTKGTEGFELAAPFDVFIDKDGCCYQYLLNNAPFTGYLKIQKTDAESGLSIPYAGAAFQIYNPDGTRVTMQYTYPELTVIDTFYTNAEGYLITPEVLPFGKGYSIVEVKAPYGYVLNSDPVYFDVTADSATEDGGITLIEVTRSNMPQKGIIRFFKTGEVFWTVTEADGIYKPVYAVKSLPGAVFEIRAAEDIYTLDGVMHYAKGEIVDTITTESDGVASSKELYLGKYEIREITAPHGMVLNGTIQTVELTYAGQEVAITETAGNLYNERQKVKISLSKVLEQNELFGIGMNGELKNIIFGLYAKTDLVADDGTVIPAGGLIEIVTFDDNGMATVSADLPLGSYYLQERSTDEHYILDDTHYEFEFSYGSQETHMVEISVNGGDPIKNDLKYGMISGRKVDEDGHVIAGAIFGLFRNDENEYTAENAYLTAESAQDGTFKFEKVPFGTWVVREIQPAKGFVLNEKAYPVTVSEDGDVVSFQLENRYIRGNIEGTKLDEDGNVIAGAVFGLFRESETEFTEETAVRVTESDSNGKFRFEDIRYGKWIIRELKPTTGYVLNEMPIEVEITEDGKTVFITVENKFIRDDIKGFKVDEDGKSVAGALFGLFTEDDTEFTEENAVLTAVSDADGVFTFQNVRFGKWIVRELKPAEGFVLNETEFPVDITTDGAVIEIKAENRHIYGAVHTTKVDKDYPDHLLTGAVFEVYRDVNENQQFDPDVDELVGTLLECEPGLYELAELCYGGYFLYEKQAPVNYVKDNGYYYFEIVTDGEMVKVENQVGIGFINAHMVGSLKIVKASSDGRVEGFSFRITGENYDEVFTTDANGEIFIEHLRIGKYTVTEVEDSASAGYKRPDPFEIELAADETLTVNVHNDKVTTDHPGSPKTGDNSHMALWVGLMLASLGVLVGTILYSRKKKHLAD